MKEEGFFLEKKIIRILSNSYILGISYLGLNPSIVDLLKIEAFEIFTTLDKYFTIDVKYLTPNAELISVKDIKMYLEENGYNL